MGKYLIEYMQSGGREIQSKILFSDVRFFSEKQMFLFKK